MRKLLISAAAIALFTLPAFAQPDRDEHGHGGQAPHGGAPGGAHVEHGGHPQPGHNPAPSRGPNGGNSGRPTMTTNPAYSRGPNGGGTNRPAPGNNPAYNRGPNGGGNSRPQGGPNAGGRPGPGGNHAGPGAGPRHDFHAFGDYHQNFNAPRRFRAPAYRRPPGWYARRWTFGEILPALFWARNYWLTDYMDYALPPPPYGAVWVRYGNDALLIDQGSGEIVTVEYGVFY